MSTRHANPAAKNPATFGRVNVPLADVWRRPVEGWARLSPAAELRLRQTQVAATDLPFRLLRTEKNCRLVQLADRTFGWLPEAQITPVENYSGWPEKFFFAPREQFTAALPIPAAVQKWLQKYAATPYLWGGTTPAGIDCSGFVQAFYRHFFDRLLPRNSRTQRKCGSRVRLAELGDFDLLFFEHKKSARSHVGLYFAGEVWHFCLDNCGLTHESLASLSTRYFFRTARRLIQPAT